MDTSSQYLIYGLYCPITGNLHYVGKSSSYLTRPLEHMSHSHSRKIREWVKQLKELGQIPIVKVLEYVQQPESLNERERHWIENSVAAGHYLLNVVLNTPKKLITADADPKTFFVDSSYQIIATFIKSKRKAANLTQDELAAKAGVGLRFIRELEQGKKITLRADKINQVLSLFGAELTIKRKDLK